MPQPADLTAGLVPAGRRADSAEALRQDLAAHQHLQAKVAHPGAVAVSAVRVEAVELRA
jgi:hypothetical protein